MLPTLSPSLTAKIKIPSYKPILRTFKSGSTSRNGLAPTFSSTGNTDQIVARLSPARMFNMIMTGKPNVPLPPKFQVDLDQVLPAAISAVGSVTSSMSSGDWGELEGLVDSDCIVNLQNSMNHMNEDQKQLVVLHPGDVFLSAIANPDKCDSGNNLQVVTFSLPRLMEIRNIRKEHKDLAEQTKKNISDSIAGLRGDKEKVKGIVADKLKDYKAKVASNSPQEIFKANEILIGNYRFVRDGPASEWTITEVAQINTMQAWSSINRLRWRVMLALNIKYSLNFSTLLRIDYMNNCMLIFLNLMLFMVISADQVP